ncbi:MCE family protein [Tomitella fengzijianii]|uniref:MCE family protein n=1 Tax=Tomitella fengzijianii TaxID=2597660 RepID=A0A516X6E6_9ACTN|nr:MCE family protein [Tomitella fengzijianii]QDQ98648.1 MCE family protein [Tomitella fengzijianii]
MTLRRTRTAPRRRGPRARPRKAAATVLAAGLCAIVVVCLMAYGERFTPTARVTVVADRAGLVLDVDADATYRGAEVGHVAHIARTDDGHVRLALDLYSDRIRKIDRNARVEIAATTVFGAKYVHFLPPERPSGAALTEGDVVDAQHVTVEINTVFENLTGLLEEVEPQKISTTLGALADGLRGQGTPLGEALESADRLVGRVNAEAGAALAQDIADAPEVTGAYADAAPDLMTALRQGITTADTVTGRQEAIGAGLRSATAMSRSGTRVLDDNAGPLDRMLHLLEPTTGLLAEYSPEYTCLLKGLEVTRERGEPAFGTTNPGMSLDVGLVPGTPIYQYPQHLPKVNASAEPGCYGLPELAPGEHAPYLVTDTGVNPYPPERTEPRLTGPTVLEYLLGAPEIGGP